LIPLPVQERATPTVSALIDATLAALTDGDESAVRIDDILATTGVSRGSLYHHFGGRDGLIDAARAVQYRRFIDGDLRLLDKVFQADATEDEWLDALRGFIAVSQDPTQSDQRLRRLAIVGAARTRPRLAEALAEEHRRLRQRLEAILTGAAERGWVRPELDPTATATFLQAFTLGRVVADLDDGGVSPDAWTAIVGQVIQTVVLSGQLAVR
jgi:AcrR family transcriptional regulator